MPNLPFTLRQLDVFASLCVTGSFGKTARDLGVSQAAVSSQIKALEEQLGVHLYFRRPGKRPVLTPEGIGFLKDCRAFHQAASALASHRRPTASADEPVSFRVRIGRAMFDNFVRQSLGAFLTANPLIDLQFESEDPIESAASELLAGRFDFGMIHMRANQEIPPHLEPLATVRGGIYGHRRWLEGRVLPLDSEYLSSLPFILPEAASSMGKAVENAFSSRGIAPTHVICRTSYYDVIATLLESGAGIASFSDFLLSVEAREEVVLLRPMHDWRLVWFRKDNRDDPRADAVQEFLFDAVPRSPAYPALTLEAPLRSS